MSADKSGTPPCGIYIRINDFSDMLKLIKDVRQMALVVNRASGYEKNMAAVELAYTAENAEKITDLIPVLQNQGLVAIVSGAIADFNSMGADGVLLEDASNADKARAALGEDAIIGVTCSVRGDIEKLNDVDYVVLPADPSLISWCAARSNILCVASGQGITNDTCMALARAGAGFVEVSDYIFGYEKGVMQSTVNVLHALDLAMQASNTLN